jgi:hypothetical protein
MSQHFESDQPTPSRPVTRLILPPLAEPVHRVSDNETPERAPAGGGPRPNQYFWEWIDSLKAVRYL